MPTITTSNVNNSGQALNTKVQSKCLDAFRQRTMFSQYGKKPVAGTSGNFGITWSRMKPVSVTLGSATLVEGVNPSDTAAMYDSVTVVPTELGFYSKVSSKLLKTAATDVAGDIMTELGGVLGEIVDKFYQGVLITGTNVRYSGGRVSRATLTSTDYISDADISVVYAKLSKQATPFENGRFKAICSTYVAKDIRDLPKFEKLHQYKTPEAMIDATVGIYNNIEFSETGNIDTITSTAIVHPTFIFGREAYGVANWGGNNMGIETHIHMDGNTENALNMYSTIGVKFTGGCVITRPDSLFRIESASSII